MPLININPIFVVLIAYSIPLLITYYSFNRLSKEHDRVYHGFYFPIFALLMLPLFSRAIGNVSLETVLSGEYSLEDFFHLMGLATICCLASGAIISKVFSGLDIENTMEEKFKDLKENQEIQEKEQNQMIDSLLGTIVSENDDWSDVLIKIRDDESATLSRSDFESMKLGKLEKLRLIHIHSSSDNSDDLIVKITKNGLRYIESSEI